MIHWEDLVPGRVFELGSRTVTREKIVEFASQWDPQGFHLDEEAGRRTMFGGVVASGWHTACICMRLYVDAVLHDAASLGSPGMSEVSWPAPVRPGDTVTATLAVLDCRPSSRHADRGSALVEWRGTNQHGAVVLVMRGRGIFRRRQPREDLLRGAADAPGRSDQAGPGPALPST